jgi:hypothetical protein
VFGVDLRVHYPRTVHAFDRKVELVSLVTGGETTALESGEAASLGGAGKWERKFADPREFLDDLPGSLPLFHLSFDRIDHGNLLEIGGSGLGRSSSIAMLHHPSGARLVPGVKGMALEMNGTGSWITTSWPGIAGNSPRTVSVWCRLPPGRKVDEAPPFALWGNPTRGWSRKFKVASVARHDGRAVLRASFGEYYVNGTRPIDDGDWHHLAVVYRGLDAAAKPLLEFYVDGERDPLNTIQTAEDIFTETKLGDARGLSIGRYELDQKGEKSFFAGAIDELRIHAGALEANEIRELAKRR